MLCDAMYFIYPVVFFLKRKVNVNNIYNTASQLHKASLKCFLWYYYVNTNYLKGEVLFIIQSLSSNVPSSFSCQGKHDCFFLYSYEILYIVLFQDL